VVGRNIVPRLLARGHEVRAIVRRAGAAPRFAAIGAETAIADIFDADALAAALDGCDAAANLASVVPRPGTPSGWDENTKVRVDGTRSYVAAAKAAGVRRTVHQSIAMINKSDDGAWVDETSAYHATPHTNSAIELENIAQESDLDWRIIRGALFYGPGTGRDEFWRSEAHAGRLQVQGDGTDYLSLIHISDMASAVVAVLEASDERETYMACDDEPVTYNNLFDYICRLEECDGPQPGGPNILPSFRARNNKLRKLGWTPHFPTFRCGIV